MDEPALGRWGVGGGSGGGGSRLTPYFMRRGTRGCPEIGVGVIALAYRGPWRMCGTKRMLHCAGGIVRARPRPCIWANLNRVHLYSPRQTWLILK